MKTTKNKTKAKHIKLQKNTKKKYPKQNESKCKKKNEKHEEYSS
jgi:hypothetical protein